MGEHGWFDKRWIFEESLRTPFLVRWPGVVAPGRADAHLTSTLDFAPTFLEAAGVAAPADLQGRSLVPLLRGESPADWRKSFYYEYYEYPSPHHVRPHHGVVTDRYKLVRFDSAGLDSWELFDLQNDPHELINVHDAPENARVVGELKSELERLRRDLKVPEYPPASAYGNRPIEGAAKP
jgi:arylsulfatase A-like enzyme